jgi:hypothetical protein
VNGEGVRKIMRGKNHASDRRSALDIAPNEDSPQQRHALARLRLKTAEAETVVPHINEIRTRYF